MPRRKASAADGLDLGSDKLYFKIGEVSEIVGVPAYVLRYWETEFKAVKPQKSRTQQRVYRRRDVETLLKIKQLLYVEKFTIAGARQQLKEASAACTPAPASGVYLAKQSLGVVQRLLGDTRTFADADGSDPAAADPARFLQDVGGARALLDDADASILSRPPRGRHR
ncbi:MAG: MerR family transcriptional regulator [Myxococcota bacterium]